MSNINLLAVVDTVKAETDHTLSGCTHMIDDQGEFAPYIDANNTITVNCKFGDKIYVWADPIIVDGTIPIKIKGMTPSKTSVYQAYKLRGFWQLDIIGTGPSIFQLNLEIGGQQLNCNVKLYARNQ